MSAPLQIHLLGTFQLSYKGQPVTAFDGFPRLQSLLAYLVLYADMPQPRAHLAHLFWPSSATGQVRANLRKLIFQLRRALPDADHFLNQEKNSIGWHVNAAYWLDVAELNHLFGRMENEPFSRDILERIAELYAGELLTAVYDDWPILLRHELQQTTTSTIERLIRLLQNQALYAEAIQYAQQLVQLHPHQEKRYRLLLELQALAADRQGGLQTYQACITMLQTQFGTEPSLETRMAYRMLTETIGKPTVPIGETAVSLIGRQNERTQLQETLAHSLRGQPHFAFISGEPGIGKTSLTEDFLLWVRQQGIITARTRSYTMQGGLALAAIAQLLREDDLVNRFDALPDDWLAQIGRLIPELLQTRPDLPKPEPVKEGWQRRQFYEALARAILVDSSPVVLFFDDLQWLDVETLEWLHYLMRFDAQAKLLIVGTFRDNEVDAHHPLEKLRITLQRDDLSTEVGLRPLSKSDTAALVTAVSSSPLSESEQNNLYANTQGNPLFIVETVRAQLGKQMEGVGEIGSMPAKMNAVIRSRLSMLSTEAYDLVKIAASVGNLFDYKILEATSLLSGTKLAHTLDELGEQRIFAAQPHRQYDFSHDKIREVALTQTGTAQKRRLNLLIARAKESIYAERLDEMVGELAIHYELAGQLAEAVSYHQRAADIEQARGAYANGIIHLEKGLLLLEQLPNSAALIGQKLTMQLSLGFMSIKSKGANDPAVEAIFNQAYQLCQQIGQDPRLFQTLYGLNLFYMMRGSIKRTWELSQQCFALAQKSEDILQLLTSHLAMGITTFVMGRCYEANKHLAQVCAYYELEQQAEVGAHFGLDPGMKAYAYWGFGLWFAGYAEQAMEKMEIARKFSQQADRPYTTASFYLYLTIMHIIRQEAEAAQAAIQTSLDMSGKHELAQLSLEGQALAAWTRGMQTSNNAQAIVEMAQSLKAYVESGSETSHPFGLNLLAQLHIGNGDSKQAIPILDEALAYTNKNGDRYSLSETVRFMGESVQNSHPKEAEQQFLQAIAIAEEQGAKFLQIRAAVSLCRLYQTQSKLVEARQLLSPIYSWFTEGFYTVDLQLAATLLEELNDV